MTSDDKTPSKPGPAQVSDTSLELARTAIALSTTATRLANAAECIRASADRCAEASRMVDEPGGVDGPALLHDVEDQLGSLAEAVHGTRRAVKDIRMALARKGKHP